MPFHSALIALLLTATDGAETTLSRIFADDMVLQRDQPVAIFGHDNPGEKIQVEFVGHSRSATSASDGFWLVDLQPLKTSATGRGLTVSEVLIAAGQSSISLQLKSCSTKPHPKNHPLIRMAKHLQQLNSVTL